MTGLSEQNRALDLEREEFVRRFGERIQELAGPAISDGDKQYMRQAAEAAWDDPDQREEGPEACAEADHSYWED